jgi:hypothetical protein
MMLNTNQIACDRPRRVAIVATSIGAVAIGLCVKFYAFGMVMCFGVFLYPLLALGHILVRILVTSSPVRMPKSILAWCLFSDAVFVVAMLLQIDQNDRFYWLSITYLYSQSVTGGIEAAALPGMRTELHYVWYGLSFGSIGLVLVSWIPVLRFKTRVRLLEASRTCVECGYPLGVGPACPECGVRPSEAVHREPCVIDTNSTQRDS